MELRSNSDKLLVNVNFSRELQIIIRNKKKKQTVVESQIDVIVGIKNLDFVVGDSPYCWLYAALEDDVDKFLPTKCTH